MTATTKRIFKTSYFAVFAIAACTNVQDSNPATGPEPSRAENILRSLEESASPDYEKHIAQLNAAELHELAENLNWDFGIERVFAILDNPEVDRGTALMLYWRNQPYDQAEYKLKKEASEGNRSGYALHLKAEQILLNRDFKTYDYPFNFIRDSLLCPEHAKRALADPSIPQELKTTDGPDMEKHMTDWCSSDERIRVEKYRADNGFSYHYEDPYADFKINRTDEK